MSMLAATQKLHSSWMAKGGASILGRGAALTFRFSIWAVLMVHFVPFFLPVMSVEILNARQVVSGSIANAAMEAASPHSEMFIGQVFEAIGR